MRLIPLVQVASRALAGNKLRSGLATLGVVIGVASVIAMISIAEGAHRSMTGQIQALGSNALFVRPGTARSGHRAMGDNRTLVLEDAEAIARECDAIAAVSPETGGSAQVKYYARNTLSPVTGVTPTFLAVRANRVTTGRFITKADDRSRARVAVLGAGVARELFGSGSPLDEKIKLRGLAFRVIGVLDEKGESWMSPDEQVLVPLSTAQKVLFGEDHLRAISLSARSESQVDEAQRQIEAVLRRRHRIPAAEQGKEPEDDFRVMNQIELMRTVEAMNRTFSLLLGSIGAVSLVVGGIGIMNIMLVSVTERTREIGIRMAVGARRGDILLQFLIESSSLGVLGGLLGIGLGFAVAHAIGSFGRLETAVTPTSIGIAFTFAVVVGLLFGVWPARRASRLDPLECLRHE